MKNNLVQGPFVKHGGSLLTECREDVKDEDEENDAPHADNDNPVVCTSLSRCDSQTVGQSDHQPQFSELRVRARLFSD